MQLVDIMEIKLSHSQCSKRMSQGYKVSILREFVDYHKDGIIALRLGQTLNEVHTHYRPSFGWH
jgi:hypothetical protein